LLLTFENFPPGTQMSTFASAYEARNFQGVTISASYAVSGVGDQAWFAAGSLSTGSINAHGDVLYIAYGSLLIIVEKSIVLCTCA
jgi:hypothetical protein